jgi:hypothetical protein
MARKLPQNHGKRSASVGGSNQGTLLRYLLALLARLESAAGPARPTAALPQIAQMEPIKNPIPRTQRRSLGPSSPAQRSAAAQRGRRVQRHRAHHSGKNQSRFPPWGSSLSEGSGSRAKNSPRVSRRSNSRLRRREASLLVLSKTSGGRRCTKAIAKAAATSSVPR